MTKDISGSTRERYDKTIRRKEKLSGYLYNMSQITFAAMVLANIALMMNTGFSMVAFATLIIGSFASLVMAWTANRVLIF